MIRVPNASPSALITNFETKCSEYFHPNVLIYVLRNRASYLSRNSQILNRTFNLPNKDLNDGISTNKHRLHILANSFNNHNLITNGISNLSKNLTDELMQLSFSIISSSSCLHPQSASTILLSFIKLNFFYKEVFSCIVDNYNFEDANPKAVSLLLYSLSKHPICSEIISHKFLKNVEAKIKNTFSYSSCQDLTTYLISISKIKELCLKSRNRNETILKSLKTIYNILLNQTICIIDQDNNTNDYNYNNNDINNTENENEYNNNNSEMSINSITENNFTTFELSNILESFYIMKHYNSDDHRIILEELIKKLPKSVNYISDALYTMKLFNINPKTPGIYKNERVNLMRLNKKFCEKILSDVTDQLNLLNIKELSQLAVNINKLRLWADDYFFRSYTRSFMSIFNKDKNEMNFKILLPIVIYFNKRYESCINREYYYSQVKKTPEVELQIASLNEISDLCGYVCETLNEFVNKTYPNNPVDNILNFTSKLRTNRNLNLMKYNYKLP